MIPVIIIYELIAKVAKWIVAIGIALLALLAGRTMVQTFRQRHSKEWGARYGRAGLPHTHPLATRENMFKPHCTTGKMGTYRAVANTSVAREVAYAGLKDVVANLTAMAETVLPDWAAKTAAVIDGKVASMATTAKTETDTELGHTEEDATAVADAYCWATTKKKKKKKTQRKPPQDNMRTQSVARDYERAFDDAVKEIGGDETYILSDVGDLDLVYDDGYHGLSLVCEPPSLQAFPNAYHRTEEEYAKDRGVFHSEMSRASMQKGYFLMVLKSPKLNYSDAKRRIQEGINSYFKEIAVMTD